MDETTSKLILLVADRFHVDSKKLKPQDDFFEKLGINSLQALDLLGDLEVAFDVTIPDYVLKETTTFQDLAKAIEGSK